jgi:membrane-bound inhibitor of C-type lysozyme
MRLRPLASLALSLCAPALAAQAVTIDLPGEEQRFTEAYACERGTRLDVEFVNVGDNSLAVVKINGGPPLVFTHVVAASGVRYTQGFFEFWTAKGAALFTKVGEETEHCQPVE